MSACVARACARVLAPGILALHQDVQREQTPYAAALRRPPQARQVGGGHESSQLGQQVVGQVEHVALLGGGRHGGAAPGSLGLASFGGLAAAQQLAAQMFR